MSHFNYTYDTPVFKGTVDFPTGVFIGGKFQEGSSKSHIEYVRFPGLSFLSSSHLLVLPLRSVINPSTLHLLRVLSFLY